MKVAEPVRERKIEVLDGFQTERIGSARFSQPPTDISEDKKIKEKAHSNYAPSEESEFSRHNRFHQKRRSRCHLSRRHYRSPTIPTRRGDLLEYGLNVFVPVYERYQMAVNYFLYRLVPKFQRFDDVLASEIQKMRKKVAGWMKDYEINSAYSISVISLE